MTVFPVMGTTMSSLFGDSSQSEVHLENNSDELFVDAVEDHIPDINTQQMEV